MVNVPLAPPTSSTSATLTAPPPPNLTPVPVTIVSVSSALENLTHVIQSNAVPQSISDGSNLTLVTALGNITVALSQQLGAAEKQNLTQQLMNLIQTSRPLTLTLQAGSPPTQGTLLIPSTAPPTTTQNVQPIPSAQPLSAPSFAVGNDFPAIVLFAQQPASVIPTSVISDVAQLLPTTRASINLAPLMETDVAVSTPLSGGALATAQPQTVNATVQVEPLGLLSTNSAAPIPTNVVASLPEGAPVNMAVTGQFVPTSAPTPMNTPQATPALTAAPVNILQAIPALAATPSPVNAQVASTQTYSPVISTLLTTGNEVVLRIDTVLPTPSDAAIRQASLPPLAPNQIVATVTGTGTGGQLILQAGNSTLFVKSQVSAPVGTSIIVSVNQMKPAPLLTLPILEPTNFQALPQAIAALAEVNPQILQQMMSSFVPQPTEFLPGALLFLFSAFKQGNVRGWLGDEAFDSLTNSGKFTIINSLSKELSSAGQPAQDAIVGDWRSYPIPLYAQEQFQALTLFVHNERDARKGQSSSASETGKIRFLIDMRLSKLGAMQIDGFVQQKKLDMILRSEMLLPEGLHSELRTAYIKALEAVGYAGTLNFQVGRQYWMAMQKSAPPGIVT